MTRRAESPKVRRWNGVVANANDVQEAGVWVVWGVAAPPEHAAVPEVYPDGEPAPDIAIAIAADNDPEFAAADDDHRWAMLVEGKEEDVDEWVLEHPVARGFAHYLPGP
jgi:hypothetical protein